jgi:hypothetical protein
VHEDEGMPRKTIEVYFEEIYKRFFMVCVALAWCENVGQWRVEVGIRGQDSIRVYFRTKTKADQVRDKLLSYMLGQSFETKQSTI